MLPTERLFDKDPYMTEFSATVLFWKQAEGAFFAALDKTAFFPEGGGQFCDLGTLYNADVLDVQEDENGVIWHKINKPLETGITVTGHIDWRRRFDFMQQHSGEHIFSGLAHTHFGAANVGFHLGLEVTTIDLDVPLNEKKVNMLEREANEAVYKNLPVEISYPSKAELAVLPYRSKKELSGRVRIVTVPGYDICACCGTHVARTGEIGIIKITSFQNYKGGTRLFMLCGGRAFADYQRKNADIQHVTTSLSIKPEELCQGVERLCNEITAHKIYESSVKRELFALKAKSLGSGERVAVFEENLSSDVSVLPLPKALELRLFSAAKTKNGNIPSRQKSLIASAFQKRLTRRFADGAAASPSLFRAAAAARAKKSKPFLMLFDFPVNNKSGGAFCG